MGCGAGASSNRTSSLSEESSSRVNDLFSKMDLDDDDNVTIKEAKEFFKGNFGCLSASAMFAEVDKKSFGSISRKDFLAFWHQVKKSGYTDDQIIEEVDNMMVKGGTWVDWDDERNTGNA